MSLVWLLSGWACGQTLVFGIWYLKQLLIQQTGVWDARAIELLPEFTGLEVLRLLPGPSRREDLWNNLAPVSGLRKLKELQLVGYNPINFSNGSATGEALSAALPDLHTLELLVEPESDQVAAVAALTQLTRLKMMMQPRSIGLPEMAGALDGDALVADEADAEAAMNPQMMQDLQAALQQVHGVLQQLHVPQQNVAGPQAPQHQHAGQAAVQPQVLQIVQQQAPQQAAAAAPAAAAAAAAAPAPSSSSQPPGQQAQPRAPAGLGRTAGLGRRGAAAASRRARAAGTSAAAAGRL
ncbi:hypothetical protein COO60DRAFT_1590128 [Scenedesmus sp. NREL 46B-D3]|nr:hypothetical protein COO60DRAFT_1590128 [Scenedesmus sp. NREL 46B-D3]